MITTEKTTSPHNPRITHVVLNNPVTCILGMLLSIHQNFVSYVSVYGSGMIIRQYFCTSDLVLRMEAIMAWCTIDLWPLTSVFFHFHCIPRNEFEPGTINTNFERWSTYVGWTSNRATWNYRLTWTTLWASTSLERRIFDIQFSRKQPFLVSTTWVFGI